MSLDPAVLVLEGLVATPPLVLLAAGAVPSSLADAHPRAARSVATGLVAAAFAAAVAAAVLSAATGPIDRTLLTAGSLPLNVGIFFDSLTAVMTLLIAGLGLVIARFALRALDGEPGQGRFFKWLAFTLGAVLAVVVARNVVMLTVAWMLTSFGLHRLLLHYPDRPWAVWAARKKFLVSRFGDVFLLLAVALCFACFGTSDYSAIFERIDASKHAGQPGWGAGLIGVLLVLGGMTKSAQLPFHSWLPDTMEAPTPVSALMHAGIINAGGYLVIRLSPLVSSSPAALGLLAAVGGLTALFGGLVMPTQTSVKRALAFSTIAQMGFMMLQCGLGAFAAAVLHIVAHSAYKAHAFLASGSVLESAVGMRTSSARVVRGPVAAAAAILAASVAVAICLAASGQLGGEPSAKPGGVTLVLILAIALTTLLWQAFLSRSAWLVASGLLATAGVAFTYDTLLTATDRLLSSSRVARGLPADSAVHWLIPALVVAGFLGVWTIQAATPLLARLTFVRALHVHAANGFYLDIPARRLTARVWGLKEPVP